MPLRSSRLRTGLGLLACVFATVAALLSAPTAFAQPAPADTTPDRGHAVPGAGDPRDAGRATVAPVEIPGRAESLRRWLTIWEVDDLVALLDEVHRRVGPPSAGPSPSAAQPGPAEPAPAPQAVAIEQRVVDLVNTARAREGLPPLEVDADLVADARAWTATMANARALAHQGGLSVPPGLRTAGENVAFRTTDDDVGALLQQQFMDSPGHRRNVLHPGFTRVGVGVVQSDGLTWVTQRFAG